MRAAGVALVACAAPAISSRYLLPEVIVTVAFVARNPGEFPGFSVPATVVAPRIVPVPMSVAPDATYTGPVPSG